MSFSEELLDANRGWWDTWQPHPFTRAVAEQTVDPELFNGWLAQDYLFVREGMRFLAILLTKAPVALVDPLADTITTWRTELELFRTQARAAGVELDVAPRFVTRTYTSFLMSVGHQQPFLVGWSVLYGVEKSYHDAWRWVAEQIGPDHPQAPWVNNWGSETFAEFTRFLARTLDELTLNVSADTLQAARTYFTHTAELEFLFWEMALGRDFGTA